MKNNNLEKVDNKKEKIGCKKSYKMLMSDWRKQRW